MTQASVYITIVLDRSGSMASQLNDTLGGFNLFLEEQKKIKDGFMTLITFSNNVETKYKEMNIKDVEKLTKENYVPSGGTALLDAIGSSIKYNDTLDDISKKMIVIITDGEENSSKKYTNAHINDLISDRRNRDWEFIFLAANQDAISSGEAYGIAPEAALTFSQQDATQEAFSII